MLDGSFKIPGAGLAAMSAGVGDGRLLLALFVTKEMVVALLEELLADAGPAASLLPSVVVELLLILM